MKPVLLAGACFTALIQVCNAEKAPESLRESGFTAMWWTEGPPHYLSLKGTPPPAVLCLRSGGMGLLIDTKSLRMPHAGRFAVEQAKDAALAAGTRALLELPAAELTMSVVCTGKDRLSLSLELDRRNLPREGELSIAAAGRRVSLSLAQSRRVTLPLFESAAEGPPAQVEAEPALAVSFDPALGCHTIRLPERPWSNAQGTYCPEEHLDRLDRWRLTLRNDGERETVARLMFVQEQHLPITGFTPMLCDPDGTPSGVPVQISKNWHQRPEKGHPAHEGPWFHGCSLVRLPAKSRRELVFQMVYARYGGVPAVSHAQFCLIGWGHNQFWDEAATGSFGESICFEPGRAQRRCFIDDMRPLMTLPVAGGKPWGWAENCGGGDFLVWVDERGEYRGLRATRTDYRAQGPCRTDVRYQEETSGGEIQAQMDVSLVRSDDYVRAFHHLRYDVARPVKWQRLTFFQLGADFYNDSPERRVAIGDLNGMREEWTSPHAQASYDRRSVPLTGVQPWVSIHGLDRAALSRGGAAASRGLMVRSWRAQFGGKPNPIPHVSTFCDEWGRGNFKTVIELVPPLEITTLLPGDYLEAELEMVIFPADAKAYYGPNEPFRAALSEGADTWRLVEREAAGNALQVKARRGTVMRLFPLVVSVDSDECVQAEVQGGVGWLPVTFTGLASHRGCELRVDGRPFSQAIYGNDFWQTDYDPSTKTWSQTFNLPRNGRQSLQLEFGPSATHTPKGR